MGQNELQTGLDAGGNVTGSKLGMVLSLLEMQQGASLAKLVEVTGWLPHTTRAALTGLRKRGFSVVSEKSAGGGASVYRIHSEAA